MVIVVMILMTFNWIVLIWGLHLFSSKVTESRASAQDVDLRVSESAIDVTDLPANEVIKFQFYKKCNLLQRPLPVWLMQNQFFCKFSVLYLLRAGSAENRLGRISRFRHYSDGIHLGRYYTHKYEWLQNCYTGAQNPSLIGFFLFLLSRYTASVSKYFLQNENIFFLTEVILAWLEQ